MRIISFKISNLICYVLNLMFCPVIWKLLLTVFCVSHYICGPNFSIGDEKNTSGLDRVIRVLLVQFRNVIVCSHSIDAYAFASAGHVVGLCTDSNDFFASLAMILRTPFFSSSSFSSSGWCEFSTALGSSRANPVANACLCIAKEKCFESLSVQRQACRSAQLCAIFAARYSEIAIFFRPRRVL